jgi:hypothetical protein
MEVNMRWMKEFLTMLAALVFLASVVLLLVGFGA